MHEGTSEQHNGVKFNGADGWIFVTRGRIEASKPEMLNEPLPGQRERLYASNNHMGNFFECVRTRKQPAAPAEVGHRSVSVCHLGVLAMRHWPQAGMGPGEGAVRQRQGRRKWLSREMRKGFDYDAV